MTEEEKKLAREYAKKFGDDNILHFGKFLIDLSPIRKESFIAGLEAGKPKWHKVADGDLPKEDVTVLLLTEVEPVTARYYSKFEAFFRMDEKLNYCIFIAPISYIAWCEIPQYTEE